MWSEIAQEMSIPWRAAESMHWQLGEQDMARRAGERPFAQKAPQTRRVAKTSVPSHAAPMHWEMGEREQEETFVPGAALLHPQFEQDMARRANTLPSAWLGAAKRADEPANDREILSARVSDGSGQLDRRLPLPTLSQSR
jgi:hypothetical protein